MKELSVSEQWPEELWERCGFGGMLNEQRWPEFDPEKCRDDMVEIAVQVGGKVRGRAVIRTDSTREQMLEAAKALPEIAALIGGRQLVKEIAVPGKLVNLVVK